MQLRYLNYRYINKSRKNKNPHIITFVIRDWIVITSVTYVALLPWQQSNTPRMIRVHVQSDRYNDVMCCTWFNVCDPFYLSALSYSHCGMFYTSLPLLLYFLFFHELEKYDSSYSYNKSIYRQNNRGPFYRLNYIKGTNVGPVFTVPVGSK
jgi:hypothetical protein